MLCNNCNNDIPEDSIYCKYCGANIESQWKTCSNKSCRKVYLPKEALFCPDCGNEINKNIKPNVKPQTIRLIYEDTPSFHKNYKLFFYWNGKFVFEGTLKKGFRISLKIFESETQTLKIEGPNIQEFSFISTNLLGNRSIILKYNKTNKKFFALVQK